MKKNFKRIVSVILCLVILCCPFANVMQPAHANPGVIWASDVALQAVSFVLGLLGISFASKGAMVEASNEYLAQNPTITEELNNAMTPLIMNPNGVPTVNMNSSVLKYFKDTLIPSVKKFFSRTDTAVSVPDSGNFTYKNIVKYTDTISINNAITAYSNARFGMNDILAVPDPAYNKQYRVVKGDNKFTYHLMSFTNATNGSTVSCYYFDSGTSGNVYSVSLTPPNDCAKVIDVKYGFARNTYSGYEGFINPYLVMAYQDNSGVIQYLYTNPYKVFHMGQLVYDGAYAIQDAKTLPYGYDIDYSDAEFMNALQKIIDLISAGGVGTLDFPWAIPKQQVEEGKQEVENKVEGKPYWPEWAMWWEKLGIKDLIDTVTQSKTITESDVKMPQLPVSIKDKFPFCVPFDVYYMIEKLNATSVAPSWNIPFKIQSLGINQNIPLDLSGWESVAAVCRWANVLLFILALVLLTRNIIRA